MLTRIDVEHIPEYFRTDTRALLVATIMARSPSSIPCSCHCLVCCLDDFLEHVGNTVPNNPDCEEMRQAWPAIPNLHPTKSYYQGQFMWCVCHRCVFVFSLTIFAFLMCLPRAYLGVILHSHECRSIRTWWSRRWKKHHLEARAPFIIVKEYFSFSLPVYDRNLWITRHVMYQHSRRARPCKSDPVSYGL